MIIIKSGVVVLTYCTTLHLKLFQLFRLRHSGGAELDYTVPQGVPNKMVMRVG